ncbi:PREDICTED: NACHT, LRR and PYD domains-containing protein 3-like [Nanorana parkeri]|uniref:NACHT, LRR and PYD domains-containing protein 3-like n=1 Tax=Nanorana parkeri TaxID=125878 RepID=UPI000854E486|nr:PREDICTED: NACHT, LRR and PYD domains-containing protein 3-like [Nanorana parkeri]
MAARRGVTRSKDHGTPLNGSTSFHDPADHQGFPSQPQQPHLLKKLNCWYRHLVSRVRVATGLPPGRKTQKPDCLGESRTGGNPTQSLRQGDVSYGRPMAASSSSQGSVTGILGKRPQTPGDLILYSLEDLKGYDFKRFKDKLSDFSYGDKVPIPRGQLEHADWISTKNLLTETYGEEGALDVMTEVFTLMDLLGPAKHLRERRAQNEWKKEYMESMKEDFQRIKEYNSRRGEAVNLQKRYTKLLLIKEPRNIEDKVDEMSYSGRTHQRIMEKRSCDEYSPTTIQTLFDPDQEDFVPKVVVLQGPAGIGKTMTSRMIMLDWASGNLYTDKFDFVFHLSCRELNTISKNLNLVGLLSRTCKLENSDDLVSILKDPGSHKKLLFIVDGFDELRWTLEEESEVCHDISEETDKEILLQRLLRKQLLKQSSLIITTRSLALEKLNTFVDDSRYVEVLGFTGEERVEYFHGFFKNEGDADKALSIIKDNDVLYTMCAVPIVCWIVCTVLKPQIKQDVDLLQYKTATSVYLLYLKGLIKYHGRNQPAQTCLKKLCALANEGVLNQQILFEEEELERHGLSLLEIESVFLNENVFHLDIETKTYYGFIHLSVQEFFAALYYALDNGCGNEEDTILPEICQEDSLSAMCGESPHLLLAVRFLFGLFNEKGTEEFSKSTGIRVSLRAKSAVEKWITGDDPLAFSTEGIFCLYETQNEDFIRRTMSRSACLEIESRNYSQYWDGEDLLTVDKMLHGLECVNSQAEGEVTISDDGESPNLSWLINPRSEMQELSLYSCDLTSSSCDCICSIMSTNKLLTSLDLTYNILEATGVKILCEGLRDPGCILQELSLCGCDLSPSCCDDLRSVLITNRSLIKLDLSFNNLEDSGVKVLCDGIRDPGCNLQTFIFDDCQATLSSCDDLRSVITTNPTLTKLDTRLNINVEESESEVDHWCTVLREREV